SLAAELLAVAQFEILHFACKRPFRHENLRADIIDQARPANLILMKPSHSSCNARADDETGTRRSQHGADFTWRRARHSARGSCLKLRKKAQSVSLSRCCFRLKVSVTRCRPAILRVWSSERAAACGGQKGECPNMFNITRRQVFAASGGLLTTLLAPQRFASAAAGNTLNIAYNVNLPSFDPDVGPSSVNPTIQAIYRSVFDQYIGQKPNLAFESGLLTGWGWNDDKSKVWM